MGLIQYYVEKAGISTISIIHLLGLAKKVRLPRALHLPFPMGRSFGVAFDKEMQTSILLDAITNLKQMNEREVIKKLPYRWKGRTKK